MREKRWAAGTWIGVLITTVMVAYALTNLFATKSYTSNLTKKQVFQFDLETGCPAARWVQETALM